MEFQKHKLPSGLRVLLAPIENSETATVLFLIGTGSKYENKKNNGVSHFLEHLFFKGTKKRPRSKDITAEIDAVGGEINAFTSEEVTGYYTKVGHQSLPLALDLVSDIACNALFPAPEIEKERGVILEEINMYEDIPQQKVWIVWDSLLYGDQPAGWSVLGLKEVIKKISREEILKYRDLQYRTETSLLVLAGNLEALKNPLEQAAAAFKNFKNGKGKQKAALLENQAAPRLALNFKETEQTHLLMGFKGGSLKPEEDNVRTRLSVLDGLLGGYMSARLFQEIREKRGWAYTVGSFSQFDTDAGAIGARAGVLNNKAEESVKVILKEFQKAKAGKISKKEVETAKNNFIGSMSLALEGSDSIASFLGKQEILENRILTPEQIFDRIKAVTIEDVKAAARKYFVNKKLNLALIGPHKKEEAFKKLLKI